MYNNCSDESFCGSLMEEGIVSESEDAQTKILEQLRSSDSLQSLQASDKDAQTKIIEQLRSYNSPQSLQVSDKLAQTKILDQVRSSDSLQSVQVSDKLTIGLKNMKGNNSIERRVDHFKKKSIFHCHCRNLMLEQFHPTLMLAKCTNKSQHSKV